MSSSKAPTLLVIGCGPGIGVSTASLFATQKFDKVALISRDTKRLDQDRSIILNSLKSSNRADHVEIKIWSVDITNTSDFQNTLQQVENFGNITCVIFNAARVEPSALFSFEEKEIVKDFMTTNIALYTAAGWALPKLSSLPENDVPSFLVTSSLLWKDPIPQMFSLSMVKASQRNLVMSLQKTYPNVHVTLLNVGGAVSKEDKFLNPEAIAGKFWELYSQEKGKWTEDLDVLGG